MLLSLNMIRFCYLLLVPEIINVNAFMNNSISSVSARNAEAAAESSYDSSYSAGLFVDCSSCECPLDIFSIVLTQSYRLCSPFGAIECIVSKCNIRNLDTSVYQTGDLDLDSSI